MRKIVFASLLSIAVTTLSACVTASTWLSRSAQGVFYAPDQLDYGHDPQRSSGMNYEEVFFKSRDGTLLTGWFVPAPGLDPKRAKGTVLHVHGNAGNLTSHWFFVSWLPGYGFNLFLFDYRGYGKSQGKPTPAGLFADTNGALDYLRSRADIDPGKLLVFGQSLGATNAIAVVGSGNHTGIRAVVADAPFYSYSRLANDTVPGSGILMNDDYSAARFITGISPIPLLMLHGTSDLVIPYRHSQELLQKAKPPKELILIAEGGHITAISDQYGETYRKKIVDFFEAALATSTQP